MPGYDWQFSRLPACRAAARRQAQGEWLIAQLRELGTVEEVASAVVWLASDEAAYITEHQWVINGGMHHSVFMQRSRNVN